MKLRAAAVLAVFLSVTTFTSPVAPAGGGPLPGIGACAPAADLGDPYLEGPGHDHVASVPHRLKTSNIEILAYTNPPPDADSVPMPPAWHGDPDMKWLDHAAGGQAFGEVSVSKGIFGKRAAIARVSSPAGFYLYDVSDPANPVELSRWKTPNAGVGYVADLKMSADGNYVYAGVQGAGNGNGLYLVSLLDPKNPKTEIHEKVPNGVHMIATHTIGLLEYVFANTAYSNGVFIYLAGVAPLPIKTLRKVTNLGGVSAHDAWVEDDPVLKLPVLHVAASYGGYSAYDVTTPDKPKKISQWSFGGTYSFYSHTVRVTHVDGKRYVVLAPEYFFGTAGQRPQLHILDATDLNNVRLVGKWGPPGNHAAGNLVFSTHNFQLVKDRLYVANYHGGVWVVDIANPAAPTALGYVLPAQHTQASTWSFWGVTRYIPSTWDVVVHEGDMYIGDIGGGLYVAHFACDERGPNGPTSIG